MAELPLLLERLANLIRVEQRDGGLDEELQPVHISSLLYLSRANRYSDTPTAITEYLGATKGTVSQSLLVLERKGLIKKQSDEQDRRVTHLELTTEGRRRVSRSWPSTRVREAVAELSKVRKKRLEDALQDFLVSLQRANGSRSFDVCHTCRLFEHIGGDQFRCGLTGEPLATVQTEKICREHEPAA